MRRWFGFGSARETDFALVMECVMQRETEECTKTESYVASTVWRSSPFPRPIWVNIRPFRRFLLWSPCIHIRQNQLIHMRFQYDIANEIVTLRLLFADSEFSRISMWTLFECRRTDTPQTDLQMRCLCVDRWVESKVKCNSRRVFGRAKLLERWQLRWETNNLIKIGQKWSINCCA